MDYLKEMNAFHDSLLANNMATGHIALWHILMYIDNKVGWAEWFSVANQTLEVLTGMSRKGVYQARNALVQKGYIEIRPRGTHATLYRIIPRAGKANSTQVSTQPSTQASTQVSTQPSTTLNRRDETKRNNDIAPLSPASKDQPRSGSRAARFVPPTLAEVEAYCRERGNAVDAKRFFDYYEVGKWKDKSGEPVRNWKQKLITWEKKQAPSEKGGKNAEGKRDYTAPSGYFL